jgi:hypothetical protein
MLIVCVFLSHFFSFKHIVLLHSTWKNKPVLLSLATFLSSCPSTASSMMPSQYQFCQLQLSLLYKHFKEQGWFFLLNFRANHLKCFTQLSCRVLFMPEVFLKLEFSLISLFMDHTHTTSLMSSFQVVEVSFLWSLSH